MWKNISAMAVLAIVTTVSVLSTGCASSSDIQPNAVTGISANVPNSQNSRYLDQKHHFHPEWVGATGH
jgi:hypothetical protein